MKKPHDNHEGNVVDCDAIHSVAIMQKHYILHITCTCSKFSNSGLDIAIKHYKTCCLVVIFLPHRLHGATNYP